MSIPRPLSAFAQAVSQHRDAWLNVLGNPVAEPDKPRGKSTRGKPRPPRQAPRPQPTGVKEARKAAEEGVRRGRFPVKVRRSLEQACRELWDAYVAYVEEAERAYAEGLSFVEGVPVLNRYRAPDGEAFGRPPEALNRLGRALLTLEALANIAEATRTIEYTRTNEGRILDAKVVGIGIPTTHPTPTELPFYRRSSLFRGRVLQSIAALRGAASAGQRAPDFQGKLDDSLTWWEWYLHEETPPARRTVRTVHEAAEALNELVREAERREVLRTPLTREHVVLLRALLNASPSTVLQVTLEEDPAIDLCRRTIGSRMAELREWGMVHRPHGEREGDALTSKGVAAFNQHRSA